VSTFTPEAVRQYADAVIETLASDFPDLRDPVVADIVREHIYTHAATGRGLEVIVDNPVSARWRLVDNHADPGRVTIGCWRVKPSPGDREREQRLQAALRAITIGD
jgi:hypothetical protein